MSSNLENRIRLLTDRAIAAKTQSELDAILPELKAAIRDHIGYQILSFELDNIAVHLLGSHHSVGNLQTNATD